MGVNKMVFRFKKKRRLRTIIILIAVFLMLPAALLTAVGFYAYTKNLALEREQRNVYEDTELTKILIANTMESRLNLAKVWGSLEATRRYLRGGFPHYEEEVMRRDFFRGYGINLFSLYGLDADKKLERFYFHDAAEAADTDFDIADELRPVVERVATRSNIFRNGTPQSGYSYSNDPGISGFMQISGIWFFISVVPVAPMDGSEAESGILVMGKALTRDELIPLVDAQGSGRFSLITIEDGTPEDMIKLEISRFGRAYAYDADDSIIYGYQVIQSLSGKDLLLKVRRDRWFTEETISVINRASVIIFVAFASVMAFFVVAADKILLRRLQELASCVENIEEPTASIELPTFISYELSSLVGALGALLQRVASSQEIVEEQNHALIYASRHDTLTGLGNTELFRIKMREAAAKADENKGRFAVMALSINDFRQVNETLGHTVGDEILVYFAARLRTIFGDRTSPFRTGGCEFSLILDDYLSHGALIVEALQMITCCKQPVMIGNRELHPSVSVGIAIYPEDTNDTTKLEQFLDLALNEAQKKKPASRYHFFRPKLYERIVDQLYLENDLAKGLSRGEFDVYLQPKLDLATNSVHGAEALVRWVTHEGVISPGKFIPMAETSGLIVPLTWAVIDKSCFYTRKLLNDGVSDFSVAVNISSQVLHNSEFLQRVMRTLDKYALEGKFLNIELTEDVLIEDAERSCQIMNELRHLGVLISIDDFGTGYSSLQYLRKMPFDWIKIDKTFIDGLPAERGCIAIIDASREIARTMGMGVVFEGVETLQQWNAVSLMQNSRMFIDQIQGYIVSKPLPFDCFHAAIKNWNGPYGPDLDVFSRVG